MCSAFVRRARHAFQWRLVVPVLWRSEGEGERERQRVAKEIVHSARGERRNFTL